MRSSRLAARQVAESAAQRPSPERRRLDHLRHEANVKRRSDRPAAFAAIGAHSEGLTTQYAALSTDPYLPEVMLSALSFEVSLAKPLEPMAKPSKSLEAKPYRAPERPVSFKTQLAGEHTQLVATKKYRARLEAASNLTRRRPRHVGGY